MMIKESPILNEYIYFRNVFTFRQNRLVPRSINATNKKCVIYNKTLIVISLDWSPQWSFS